MVPQSLPLPPWSSPPSNAQHHQAAACSRPPHTPIGVLKPTKFPGNPHGLSASNLSPRYGDRLLARLPMPTPVPTGPTCGLKPAGRQVVVGDLRRKLDGMGVRPQGEVVLRVQECTFPRRKAHAPVDTNTHHLLVGTSPRLSEAVVGWMNDEGVRLTFHCWRRA